MKLEVSALPSRLYLIAKACTLLCLLMASQAYAISATESASGLVYHGRILKPNGQALEDANVKFNFKIYGKNASKRCLLYEEEHSGVNMTGSKGAFELLIGTGQRLAPTSLPGGSFGRIFLNSKGFVQTGVSCNGGPATDSFEADSATRDREIEVTLVTGDDTIALPAQSLRAVPWALQALEVGGYSAEYLAKQFLFPGSSALAGLLLPRMTTAERDAAVAAAIAADSSKTQAYFKGLQIFNTTTNSTDVYDGSTWQSLATAAGNITLLGDVTGTNAVSVVAKIQGQAVAATAPSVGQVLKWNGTAWEAAADASGSATFGTTAGTSAEGNDSRITGAFQKATDSLAGDVSGLYGATVVDKIKGKAVVPAAYALGQVLRYDGTNWVNTAITAADISDDINIDTGTTGTLPVARGGTNSTTALNNNRMMISSGGAIVEGSALTNGQMFIGSTGGAPVAANITGTANQIIVGNGAGSITLSTPQDIHTAASPTFAGMTATGAVTLNAANEVRFADAVSSQYVGFKSPAVVASNLIWTLPAVDGTSNQVLTTNGAGILSWSTPSGVGDALTTNPLSQFAATTSAQLSGVLSDETGTGLAVFATSPTFTTNITAPMITGGTGTTSALTYKTTSGIGTTGADHIFQVGNNGATEAMRILNSGDVSFMGGNVGIGTNAPTAWLHLKGAASEGLLVESTGSWPEIDFQADSATNDYRFKLVQSGSNGDVQFRLKQSSNPASSTDSKLLIKQNGNVGIGTTTPGAPLDVKGAIRLSGATSGYTGFQPAAVAGSTVWTLPAADGTSNQVLTTNGAGILSWSTPSSGTGDALTTNPLSQFAATTSAQLSGVLSDETGTGLAVFATSPTFTTNITAPMITGGTGNTSALTYKTTSGVGTTGADHIFQVGNNGATEAMRILNSGNVGIGTTTPGAKLEVSINSAEMVKLGKLDFYSDRVANQDEILTSGTHRILRISNGTATNNPEILISGKQSSNPGLYISGGEAISDNPVRNMSITGTNAYDLATVNQNGADVIVNGGAKSLGGGTDGDVVLANTRGNVGIGITSPTSKLHVSSTQGTQTIQSTTVDTPSILKLQGDQFGNNVGMGQIQFNTATTTVAQITGHGGASLATGYLTFSNRQSNILTEAMRIDTLGNVGIGDTTPDAKLDVEGGAIQAGAKGAGAGNGGEVRFEEETGSGNDYVGLRAPDTIAGNIVLTLPSALPGSTQVLQSDTSGNLSWVTVPSSTTTFVQDGNSFAGPATLGTNDNFSLNFETNNTPRMTILNDGKVGINQPVPTETLDVAGSQKISGSLRVGQSGTTFTSSTFYPALPINSRIFLENEITSVSETWVQGITNFLEYNPSGNASTIAVLGQNSEVRSKSTNTQNIGSLIGSNLEASHNGTGTVTVVYGSASTATRAAGTITYLYGADNAAKNTAGGAAVTNAIGTNSYIANANGTITTAKAINAAVGRPSGTITNGYGVYIENIQATNKWSLFANDATAPSYFAGNVGIGTTAPGSALDVKGVVKISGSTSGAVGFAVPAVAGSATYTWPSAAPASNMVLQSDNTGTLSWIPAASGTGDALVANPLSQFAATTSAQMAGVLSDETGTGLAVFATSPTFTTNITAPMITGGTGTTSSLTYKTTSGVGTTGADHIFQVGNNGGTEAMRILNSGNVSFMGGNVGVGTATPSSKLHVIGDGEAIRTSTSSGGGAVHLRMFGLEASNKAYLGSSSNSDLIFRTNDADRAFISAAGDFNIMGGQKLRVEGGAGLQSFSMGGTGLFGVDAPGTTNGRLALLENGNFGIGTAAPSHKLDIVGPSIRLDAATASNNATINLVGRNAGNVAGTAQIYANYLGGIEMKPNTGQGYNFRDGANVTALSILPSGKVGIGTVTPAFLLQVTEPATGNGVVAIGNSDGNSNFGGALNFLSSWASLANTSDIAASVEGVPDNTSGGRLLLKTTTTGGTLTERMRIDSAGNVGIGTTTPGAPLDVKGAIRMSGSTSGYTGFQPAAAAGATVWTLPATDGTSNQVLTTNGAGTLSWSTPSGVGDALTTNPLSQFAATTSAQLSGVLSDETGTGLAVFATSPTFTTNITTPMITGGTGTTSTLTYKATSGVGTTGADHIFQVGNNGATEAMRILNSGNVGIGTTNPGNKLQVGSNTTQTSALIGARASGNAFEFGHSNSAGYASTLGVTDSDGNPSLCFNCEVSTNLNGYRTRGLIGTIIKGDTAGGLQIGQIATASADNQGITEFMRVTSTGNVGIGTTAPGNKLQISSNTTQTSALIGARGAGNAFEFGHPNGAGYGSTLAATNTNGYPSLCFNCEIGTNLDSYRTRGVIGTIIKPTSMVVCSLAKFQRQTQTTRQRPNS